MGCGHGDAFVGADGLEDFYLFAPHRLAEGVGAGEKAALLPLVAAAMRPRWALGGAALVVGEQLVVRGGVGEIWAPSAERIATTTGLGRWVRIALTLGVPALLAVPRLRNAPRPLVVGLAGVAALLVYAVVAARVDGRFALLALPFTVPVAASSWVALRHFPTMHTNPVAVVVGGKPIRASRASAKWCVGVIEQLWKVRGQPGPGPRIADAERPEAEKTFQQAVEIYRRIAAEAPEGS